MQRQAGSLCRTRRRSTSAAMAKGAGYLSAYNFDDLEDFATSIEDIMQEDGPILIAIKVQPEIENLPIGLRERRVYAQPGGDDKGPARGAWHRSVVTASDSLMR